MTFIIINTCGCAGIAVGVIDEKMHNSAMDKLPTYFETKQAWGQIPDGYGRVVVFYPGISSIKRIASSAITVVGVGGVALSFKINNIYTKGLFLFDQTFLFLDLPAGSHSIKFRGQIFASKPVLFEVIPKGITFIMINNDGSILEMKRDQAEENLTTICHKYKVPLPFNKQPKKRDISRYINDKYKKICNPPCPSGTQCDSTGNCISNYRIPSHFLDLGVGYGLEYGGIFGINAAYIPIRYFSVFIALGYQPVDLGWNAGIKIHVIPEDFRHMFRFNLQFMYGINGVTYVPGNDKFNKTFRGITPGFGFEFMFGAAKKNGFDFDLNSPIHDLTGISKQAGKIRDNGIDYPEPFPLSFSIGYHHEF